MYWDKTQPILSALLPALDLEVASKSTRRKRSRSPSLASALKQAAKAGAPVSGATIEDGKITLTFGEAGIHTSNPWDRAIADLAKGGKAQ